MKPRVRDEINDIIRELYEISRELEDISDGIEHEFKGIGSGLCAKSIRTLSRKYTYVRRELSEIIYKI